MFNVLAFGNTEGVTVEQNLNPQGYMEVVLRM
jgi:hypothetical protein